MPKWTKNAIPGAAGKLITHRRQSTAGGPFDQVFTVDEFSIRVKRVCETNCNNGWMNDLETAVRPFLKPMIGGVAKPLYRGGQEAVAAWAAKTALALNLATPEKSAPLEHYREMNKTHRPPPNTYVWLAAYEMDGPIAYHHTTKLTLSDSRRSSHGYATTLAVGHLILQVVGHIGIEDVAPVKNLAGPLAKFQVWPFESDITWPPPWVLDWGMVQTFSRIFEN